MTITSVRYMAGFTVDAKTAYDIIDKAYPEVLPYLLKDCEGDVHQAVTESLDGLKGPKYIHSIPHDQSDDEEVFFIGVELFSYSTRKTHPLDMMKTIKTLTDSFPGSEEHAKLLAFYNPGKKLEFIMLQNDCGCCT